MSKPPLMPKATAVWLIDHTALTFEQIADFCGLHDLEVKGIADGDVAQGIIGQDPVVGGQLAREQIERGEADPNYRLELATSKVEIPEITRKRRPRYTPVSRRQDRPDAIAWLLRNHPEVPDSQIMKLVGTTKPTIESIRNRTHWNSPNIKPVDPVTLGLCSQMDLDAAVQKAGRKLEAERKKIEDAARKAGTLMPASKSVEAEEEATAAPSHAEIVRPKPAGDSDRVSGPTFSTAPSKPEEEEEFDAERVFANIKPSADKE